MTKHLNFIVIIFSTIICLRPTPVAALENSLCNYDNVEKHLENPHLITLDIKTKKTRKWAKNYLKILNGSSLNIIAKYKKKYASQIIATFENGLICNFNAKIRVNGDWKDHIHGKAPFVTSLDVELLTGNIGSAIKFKLFIPHTRNGDNEIFVTTLLKSLGFIAPRTYYVGGTLNNQITHYIFQEKAKKEMIEAQFIREAPILEGNEKFVFSNSKSVNLEQPFDDRFGLARVSNKNWAKKGPIHLSISGRALTILNKAYLNYLMANYPTGHEPIIDYGRYISADILANGNSFGREHNQKYSALLIALRAAHGLRPHNRTFYYDPIYQYFRPIYFDGNSTILYGNANTVELKTPTEIRYGHGISPDEAAGAPFALISLNKLDPNKLLKSLNESGMKVDITELKNILNNVKGNLKQIMRLPVQPIKIVEKPYFTKYSDPKKRLVFKTSKNSTLDICNFSITKCKSEQFNLTDYSNLLSGRFENDLGISYIYLGGSKSDYLNFTNEDNKPSLKESIFDIENNVKLIAFGDLSVKINSQSKEIFLEQKELSDKALIRDGKLGNWTIHFKGINSKSENNNQRFDSRLLTGCLTFLDMAVDQIKITASNVSCEDAVNFLRVRGNILAVNIENAFSDALDVDYSNLNFDKIVINYAGNDCVDFSSGNYTLYQLNLSNCGDKAISIGEASTAELEAVSVNNSNIGIAVKDSSHIIVKHADLQNVATCLYAARKKQEYWGGKLQIQKYNCPNGSNYSEVGSKIEVIK